MKLFYIANARMPSEKAHGIQIAKMCEAFLDEGIDLTLVVPKRKNTDKTVQEFYGLRQPVPMVRLAALDWYDQGRIGYGLSTISFMISYSLYLLRHAKKEKCVVYTVDLDHIAYAPLALLGIPFFSEMHGGKPDTLVHRALFKKVKGVIATNPITRAQLEENFNMPAEHLLVEPNGVDFSMFKPQEREVARAVLHLPTGMTLALYVGRFFDWKGLEILADVVKLLPPHITLGIIGGTPEEFTKITARDSKGIVFYGEKTYTEVPLWASAADMLLVLGTKRDEQSYRYTSPMKVFEYMAMQRTIVASKTPALESILGQDECIFYEPDNVQSLAESITKAAGEPAEHSVRTGNAYRKAQHYSWSARAKRIHAFMNQQLSLTL